MSAGLLTVKQARQEPRASLAENTTMHSPGPRRQMAQALCQLFRHSEALVFRDAPETLDQGREGMPREHPGGLGITIKVASSQQDQVLLPTCPHLELKLCDPEQLLTRAQPQGQGPERGGLGPEARETFTLSQQQLGGTSPGTDTGGGVNTDARTRIPACCIHLQHTGNNEMTIQKAIREVKTVDYSATAPKNELNMDKSS